MRYFSNLQQVRQIIIQLTLACKHMIKQKHQKSPTAKSTYQDQEPLLDTVTKSSVHSPKIQYYDNLINPLSHTFCDECGRQITKTAHFMSQTGDYCVLCFANLDPFPKEYHIIQKLNFAIIDPSWTALEEVLLFSALQKHGHGSWSEIKKEMASSKTIEQIQRHYQYFFSQIPQSYPKIIASKDKRQSNPNLNESIPQISADKQTKRLKGVQLKMLKKTPTFIEAKPKEYKNIFYDPKRGDFQIEYDNDLELLIAEMEFCGNDTSEETALKYQVLEIFSRRLDRRNSIKDFVIERKLLNLSELNKIDRKRTKEQRQIAAMLKPYARFHSAADHESLIAGIAKENWIRSGMPKNQQDKLNGFIKQTDFSQTCLKSQSSSKKHREIYESTVLSKQEKLKDKKKNKSLRNGEKLEFMLNEEYEICQRLELKPIAFVLIKETILAELSKRKDLQASFFYSVFKLKEEVIEQLFQLLQNSTGFDGKQNEE